MCDTIITSIERKFYVKSILINAIRFLGIDAINKANSGHPGVVMGAAPMAYSLFTKQLRINPDQPKLD